MKEQLAELRVNDYVRAEGVDTRGHTVVRTGRLLVEPRQVTAQRHGQRTAGWRLCVGGPGTDPKERSTWVTLFADSGSVEQAEEPKVDEWQNTELRMIPGLRLNNRNLRFHFGGKGGKRSAEPSEPVILARVRVTPDYRYEICDVDTGDVLLDATPQTQIWWLPAKPVEPEDEQGEPAAVSAPGARLLLRGDDLGQPVHHVVTDALVGYLTHDKFIPIEQVEQR
ncbi:hypothetical protein ABTY53_15435 [Streptomyces noursei]|uniref:hypothetical protein n=1 Tax=Streptomyces noursei TaxID=1971 RepID=UPI00331CB379